LYHIKAPTAGDASKDPNHASSVPTPTSETSSAVLLLTRASKKVRKFWPRRKGKTTLRERCEDILNAGVPVRAGRKEENDREVRDNPAALDGGDAVEGGTVVREMWFAGCHSGKVPPVRSSP
jgi:hypothetical protein